MVVTHAMTRGEFAVLDALAREPFNTMTANDLNRFTGHYPARLSGALAYLVRAGLIERRASYLYAVTAAGMERWRQEASWRQEAGS